MALERSEIMGTILIAVYMRKFPKSTQEKFKRSLEFLLDLSML